MPSITVRRIIGIVAAAAIAAALFAAMLPIMASTQIVRDRIADEMSAWSGYRVMLGDPPEIRVWPTFHAILKDVTLADREADGDPPVMRAERVEIELSAIAALRGGVTFNKVRLFRPVLHVEPIANGLYMPDAPSSGRVARSVEIARAVVKTNPTNPDQAALPSEAFGSIEFTDGRVVHTASGKTIELITGLSGKVAWNTLNRAAVLTATGIWRGESVSLEMSSAQPLILFAGGSAPVSFSMKSAPLTASFEGSLSFSDGSFFDGSAKFASPSLRRTLEWSRAEVAPGPSIGSVSLSSKVSGNAQRLKLENAEVAFDGNPGTGALDVSLAGAMPGVSGTLAFDTLDLRSFLAAFTPLAPLDGRDGAVVDQTVARHANLDLRLSVVKATAGPVTLANVAATAQVKPGLAVFDISDSAVFGGNVQTGVRIDRKFEGNQVELRFLATDIDGGQFAKAAGLTPLFPQAKGTLSLMLKGSGTHWREVLRSGEGQFAANFGTGRIAGINLPSFLKRAANGGFFALSEVGDGMLPIDGIEVKASLSGGVARIDKGEVKSGEQVVALGGIVPYLSRSLALSGSVYPAKGSPTGEGGMPSAFFVGGSWDAPFISPVVSSPTAQ